jgi:MFS family permease
MPEEPAMSDQTADPPPAVATRDTDEVLADPRTGRRPGLLQVAVLMFSSCLPILGAVLLAPVLPMMQAAFADVSGSAALVPLVLTAPALVIGLLAPVAGRIVDAFGRKNLLVGALLAYTFVGTAPLYLESLPMILLSRIGVGLTEAAIRTCCTTLIATTSPATPATSTWTCWPSTPRSPPPSSSPSAPRAGAPRSGSTC